MASDQSSNTGEKQYKGNAAGRTGADVLAGVKVDRYKPAGFDSAKGTVPNADAERTPGSDSKAQGNPGY